MKKKQAQDAVIKAIREICRERNLLCATTREIAERTGLGRGAVYGALRVLRRYSHKVVRMTYAADDMSGRIDGGWAVRQSFFHESASAD